MIYSFNNISSTPAHKNINAALIPNDENGAPIIDYLQGKTPPSALVNGSTEDTQEHVAVPSVLLNPT